MTHEELAVVRRQMDALERLLGIVDRNAESLSDLIAWGGDLETQVDELIDIAKAHGRAGAALSRRVTHNAHNANKFRRAVVRELGYRPSPLKTRRRPLP